jgi:heme exporter protein CcmB
MSLWRTIWLVLSKDVLVELRTREVVVTMGLFALLMVIVFAFAFHVDVERARDITPGILWVVLLFSATVGLSRVFERERHGGCLDVLLRCPAGPHAVFVAKVLGVLIFTTVVLVVTIPVMLIFLSVEVPREGIALFVGSLALGTFGFTCVGTLVAGMLSSSRLRDVLLPVVVYPLVIPVVISGVELTHVALGGGLPGEEVMWLKLMVGFDMLFAVIPLWVFPRVMVD